ncbi:SfnB family sulfur acquisition oxidoreductase [Betaproteobacteria bacterium]|nr:SfnB family sulfur acquisition oxidoreductase [Betaproteobacteria bacterium]GHU19335.1 SfnB family sulfur acquisition oxidoreductase [Betaproteobacteria bacterium]
MSDIQVQVGADRLPLPPGKPYQIKSEAEALAIASELAAEFRLGAAKRDRDRLLPWDEIERYTRSGLGAITIPKEYGGLGASNETLAKVFITICAVDPSLGQIPQNHFALIQTIKDLGTEAQKKRWFDDVLAGNRLGNAGPEKKSVAAKIQDATVKLTQTPEGLRASGTRYYSTGSLYAHWVPLRAADEQGRPILIRVRRDAPGLKVVDDWSSFGQKTTASGTVILDKAPVAAEDVIEVWKFADVPTLSGPVSQLVQASIDTGIALGAFAEALDFVREHSRPWLDSGVAQAVDDPYIIHDVGALQIQVHSAEEATLAAARLIDELGREPVSAEGSARASAAIAVAKVLTVEAALDVSEKLFELAGSASTRAIYNLDRHWRNARTHTLHDPVRWKFHLLGNYLLNGVLPKRHQWN